jgi:AcrR family transcriptional regulator
MPRVTAKATRDGQTQTGRGRGRPRDPDLEQRAYVAAVELYEEFGWAGFSFEAVAARARVGKAAIYRRWPSKADLLSEALTARTRGVTSVDTGSLRGDLVQLAEQLLANYTSPAGLVSLRVFVDAPHHPELAQRVFVRTDAHLAESRAIIARAIARGELAQDGDSDLIIPTVSGAILHTVLSNRDEARTALARDGSKRIERLVDFVLRANDVSALQQDV